MRVTMQMVVRAVVGLALILSLSACVATPVAQRDVPTSLEPTVGIVIGPPTIEYRDVESDLPRSVSVDHRERVVATIETLLEAELRAKGFAARRMTPDEIGQLQLERTAGGLFEVARLRKQGVAPAIQEARDRVRKAFPAGSIFSVRSRFYLGPGAFWEPMSGQIRSSSERVLFEGRLIAPDQDRVLWEQAVQIRESLNVSESTLKDMVQMLLNTLHSTSRGKGETR